MTSGCSSVNLTTKPFLLRFALVDRRRGIVELGISVVVGHLRALLVSIRVNSGGWVEVEVGVANVSLSEGP